MALAWQGKASAWVERAHARFRWCWPKVGRAVAAAGFRCPSPWQISWGKGLPPLAASKLESPRSGRCPGVRQCRVWRRLPARPAQAFVAWGLVRWAEQQLAQGPFVEPKAPPRQRPIAPGVRRRVGRGRSGRARRVRPRCERMPGGRLRNRAAQTSSRLPRQERRESKTRLRPQAGLPAQSSHLSAHGCGPLLQSEATEQRAVRKRAIRFTSSWATQLGACSAFGHGNAAWPPGRAMGIPRCREVLIKRDGARVLPRPPPVPWPREHPCSIRADWGLQRRVMGA